MRTVVEWSPPDVQLGGRSPGQRRRHGWFRPRPTPPCDIELASLVHPGGRVACGRSSRDGTPTSGSQGVSCQIVVANRRGRGVRRGYVSLIRGEENPRKQEWSCPSVHLQQHALSICCTSYLSLDVEEMHMSDSNTRGRLRLSAPLFWSSPCSMLPLSGVLMVSSTLFSSVSPGSCPRSWFSADSTIRSHVG